MRRGKMMVFIRRKALRRRGPCVVMVGEDYVHCQETVGKGRGLRCAGRDPKQRKGPVIAETSQVAMHPRF